MRKGILLLLLLVTAVAAQADHYADTYVIPIAGHTAGANGTTWMSDIAIRNFRTTPLDVQLIVIESGFDTFNNVFPLDTDDIDGTITIAPNSTVLLRDALDDYRGLENVTGAVVLGASAPFAVTSRVYNNNMTVGQTVPAARDFLDNTLENADNNGFAYVPGIISNSRARTNVGFVAGAGPGAPMTVEISVRAGNGNVLGTRNITVNAGTFMQLQVPLSSITTTQFEVGSVDFRVASGEGVVVPYASIIDNASGAATYIMGTLPETTAATSRTESLFKRLLVSSF
ncbi:MAG TPA: hypothetical protein VGF48_20525 [Thermoanaerobaculia bacterium]|jgi:hypothetical protein